MCNQTQFPDSQGGLQEQKAEPPGTNIDRAEYLLYALGNRPVRVPPHSPHHLSQLCASLLVQQSRQNKNTRSPQRATAQHTAHDLQASMSSMNSTGSTRSRAPAQRCIVKVKLSLEREREVQTVVARESKNVCRNILDENIFLSNFVSPLQKLKM